MDEMYIEIQSDKILQLREISSKTLSVFDLLSKKISQKDSHSNEIKNELNELQDFLNETNKELIKSMRNTKRRDVGSLIQFFTYSQRLKAKLSTFYHLAGVKGRETYK